MHANDIIHAAIELIRLHGNQARLASLQKHYDDRRDPKKWLLVIIEVIQGQNIPVAAAG